MVIPKTNKLRMDSHTSMPIKKLEFLGSELGEKGGGGGGGKGGGGEEFKLIKGFWREGGMLLWSA